MEMADKEDLNSPEQVRDQVQTWLMGEGWSLSEKSNEGASWLLQAEDPAQRRLLVGQTKSPADQVRIQATIVVAADHREHFEALPAEVKDAILWELRFRLLNMSVDFSGIGEPLERVTVAQRIYLDGLTKDRFLQRVAVVKNALIAVIWSIGRRLSHLPAPSSHGDVLIH
jgi:hypothetical protein